MDVATLAPHSVFYYNRLAGGLRVTIYLQNSNVSEPMLIRYSLGEHETGLEFGVILSAIPPQSERDLSVPVVSGDGLHTDQGGRFQILQFH